jgi:triphosphoribosyl-dephospho-CoA synthase
MSLEAAIARAFTAACLDELAAPKPGNVHVFADGHRMTAADFVRSAEAAAPPLARAGARVGRRIHDAVEATFAAAGSNTNLGIILLCAPLAAAAEAGTADLRASLTTILADLDVEDAALTFRAIARAAPAGLGRAERHDVHAPATVTLREAMAEARERDSIARQYVTDFESIFELGLACLEDALHRCAKPEWATLATYLAFLARHPDSHILRKHGAAAAEDVRRSAAAYAARLQAAADPAALVPDLLSWDAALKARAINPGTSADLTVGTLFAHRLRNDLPFARKSG